MIDQKTLKRRRERDRRMHDEAIAAGKTPVPILRDQVSALLGCRFDQLHLEVIDQGGTEAHGESQVRIEILIDGKDLTPDQERLFVDYLVRLGLLRATCSPGTVGD